jgi:hypothetical protein
MNKSTKIGIGFGIAILLTIIIILIFIQPFNKSSSTSTTNNNFHYETSSDNNTIQCNRTMTSTGTATKTGTGSNYDTEVTMTNSGDVATYNVTSTMHLCPRSKVTWCNGTASTNSFTVTSDTPGIFDSGDIAPEQCFSYIFNIPGDFRYHSKTQPQTKVGQIIIHDYS